MKNYGPTLKIRIENNVKPVPLPLSKAVLDAFKAIWPEPAKEPADDKPTT